MSAPKSRSPFFRFLILVVGLLITSLLAATASWSIAPPGAGASSLQGLFIALPICLFGGGVTWLLYVR